MKRAVITLGTDKRKDGRFYTKGRIRLKNSLQRHCKEDFFVYKSESQVNAPLHADNSHAFKVYCFEHLLSMGYNQIIWLDCSVFVVRDLGPIFEALDKYGYVFMDSGFKVGNWTNDRALNYFNLTRDETMNMTMLDTKFFALDFTHQKSNFFYDAWKESMLNGIFNGKVSNINQTESQDVRCNGHRHDQSCASIIYNQIDMNILIGNHYLDFVNHDNQLPSNENICLFARGLG
jgi:hypothetical protein